jgi:hypothetical protein
MLPGLILFVFVDGIGYGTPGAPNPFDGAPGRWLAPLREPLRAGEVREEDGAFYGSLDASLGYPGLPQSATGQGALFTGEDAMAVAGGHLFARPTKKLGRFIHERSLLGAVRRAGKRAAFVNAYDDVRAEKLTRIVRDGVEPETRLHAPSASTWAALAEGGELRTFRDVDQGSAATFDLTGEIARAWGVDAPRRSIPEAARAVLAGARELDVALFETFLTDMAGHSRDFAFARHEIARLERFLDELVRGLDRTRDLLVVTSDHGNLEDLSMRTHTHGRVPLLAVGHGAEWLTSHARDLRDVPRAIARRLQLDVSPEDVR